MKNLLIELQDSKREMEEKLNHVVIQIVKLPTEHTDFRVIMEKTRMQNSLKKKRRNSVPRTSLYMVLKNLPVAIRMMLLNLTISI